MITSTLLFSLHIGISYYKHYSFVSGYNQVMEKHKQTFVTDETLLTILSPYFLLLILENILSSILLDLPIVLLLAISLLIGMCINLLLLKQFNYILTFYNNIYNHQNINILQSIINIYLFLIYEKLEDYIIRNHLLLLV